MSTFTYVTVSYCYVGVSYPRVGYADEGYSAVSYPVVGYGFVGVSYRYVSEGYRMVSYDGVRYGSVGYRGVWSSEMWRRTHPQGLTPGVAVGRMEVQQGEREKGNPNGHRDRLLRRARRLLHRRPGRRPGRLRRLSPKAPAPAGAFPCPQTPLRGPRRPLRAPQTAPPRPPCRRGSPGPLSGDFEARWGRPRRLGAWRSRARRRPRAITQRRCCENPGT